MTIKQCEYAIKIAQCGSFCEASNRLFISQANLSMAIKDLEDELGAVIFNRSNKGITLTNDGVDFLRYAEKIVSQSHLISERFKTKIKRKHLSVYTQHYDFAADTFSEFVNKNSSDAYYFVFKETQTDKIIKSVKNNSCDLGLIVIKEGDTQTERYLKNNKILFKKIGKTKPHIFVRQGHPVSNQKYIDFKSMSDYPYISYGQSDYGSGTFREELTEEDDSLHKIEINDRATLMNLLISTDSFTVGTGIMKSKLNMGSVVSIPVLSSENYNIVILTAENTVHSNEAEEFSKMLADFFKNQVN